jgi:adenine-specific DNA methylase
MESFFLGTGKLTKKQLERNLRAVQDRLFPPPDVDIAWHVRAWGWWVLQRVKAALSNYYPIVEGKETVAYLWARTVKCKNCRATIPLLKTRWLCKNDKRRILLTMEPNPEKSGVVFGVQTQIPQVGGNSAQRRESDKRLGAGTMSSSGVACPCCKGTIMTMEELRIEGRSGRIGSVMTCVVVSGEDSKEYRSPTDEDVSAYLAAQQALTAEASLLPFGLPTEPTPGPAGSKQNSSSLRIYGLLEWKDVFNDRQLLTIATLIRSTRDAWQEMRQQGIDPQFAEGVVAYLACAISRVADRCSTICTWTVGWDKIGHTFTRYALPMTWDYAESVPVFDSTGGYPGAVEWVARYVEHALASARWSPVVNTINDSALSEHQQKFDAIITDPPYYDAIQYADLMDFFYVWLRRVFANSDIPLSSAFSSPLSPKWNADTNDGELIEDPGRFGGDKAKAHKAYEDGMFRAFRRCFESLLVDGRLVVVFANKQPDAWEALVSAIIRAGFVVSGSWPIQTEMSNRTRALSSAALASSVWLVCKKRPETSRPGWDTTVLAEMTAHIQTRLREFWDAGIRGPDFVWSATGPALEIYSKHPVVKKANAPGELMTVSDFLSHVRRIVVDFIVGQVLTHSGDSTSISGLDDVTTYYILHRNDFGFDDAPIGACILYALSCGLSDRELTDRYDLLVRKGSSDAEEESSIDEGNGDDSPEGVSSSGGSKVKLRSWQQRHRKNLGEDIEGRPAPLVDQVHRLMHLWKAGDVVKVDEYLESHALRRNAIFSQLIQALIELSESESEERTILESLGNYVTVRGQSYEDPQMMLDS